MIDSFYIHIPFCSRICSYCDFPKVLSGLTDKINYLKILKKEFEYWKSKYNFNFKTTYIGGGTPSVLNEKELIYFLKFISPFINNSIENTFEANPDSLTENKIKILKEYGINRVSLGVQTFNEKHLKLLKRTHEKNEIFKCYELLLKHNISNINLDFIFGLPNQTINDIKNDIKNILQLSPSHISYYNLIFEPNTEFFTMRKQNYIKEINDNIQFDMYTFIQNELYHNGFEQYEISNWSKKNKESFHNLNYWYCKNYVGIGLGAHSLILNRRISNTKSIEKYLNGDLNQNINILTFEQQIEEFCFLSLRTLKGINKQEFFKRFNMELEDIFGNIIKKHVLLKNIINTDKNLFIRDDKLFVCNFIMRDFLLDAKIK